jgi:hypothetical protein
MKSYIEQGVSVTQSGFVMGTVFIATIIFTPLCGKFADNCRVPVYHTNVFIAVLLIFTFAGLEQT